MKFHNLDNMWIEFGQSDRSDRNNLDKVILLRNSFNSLTLIVKNKTD